MHLECMSKQEAERIVRSCLEQGEIVPGKHFRDELINEDLSFEDAWRVLKTGKIYDPPEQDLKSAEWKYRLEGYESGSKWVVIVLSFKSRVRTLLITVFSVKAREKRS